MPISTRKFKILARPLCVAMLAAGLASGCGSDSSTITTDGSGAMTISVPESIRSVRAVRDSDLQLRISVNGETVRTIPVTNQDNVQVSLSVPAGRSNEIGLAWYVVIGNSSVLLANFSDTLPETSNALSVATYNSSGDGFDFDGDNRSNLAEVRDNRNPLDLIDLEVPFSTADFMPANVVITNDGIDNNTSGDPIEPDQESTFSVWHNGTDLNFYLCGQDRTLSESSEQYWHDDTVFIFLDGQDSDNTTYDGLDDYQIAFVRSTEELIVSKGAMNPGCPDGQCITYNFFNNTASCEYELTASFPLASMNMVVGERFGLDVEFTDDDNGGLREDAATWIGFNDSSDIDPSTFGTARLQQP